MREKYWAMYERVKYSERYLYHHRNKVAGYDNWIKGGLIVASLSSVANLALWDYIPFLWAIITVLAQIVSAVAYLLPFGDQVKALDLLLPELDQLLNRIDHDWDCVNTLHTLTDAQINDLVLKYDTEFSSLESKYTSGIRFASYEDCKSLAEDDCKAFKYTRFGITQVDYLEEVLNNAGQ